MINNHKEKILSLYETHKTILNSLWLDLRDLCFIESSDQINNLELYIENYKEFTEKINLETFLLYEEKFLKSVVSIYKKYLNVLKPYITFESFYDLNANIDNEKNIIKILDFWISKENPLKGDKIISIFNELENKPKENIGDFIKQFLKENTKK